MKYKALCCIALAIILILSLGACDFHNNSNNTVSADYLESISRALESDTTEAASSEETEERRTVENIGDDLHDTEEEFLTAGPDTACYWVKGSKVYHLFHDCTYLTNSQNVNRGTLDEALESGCDHICHLCKKPQKP